MQSYAWVKLILAALVWVATTSWVISRRNSEVDTRLSSLDSTAKAVTTSLVSLQETSRTDHDSIVRLETNQGNMKESLTEIKDLIKENRNTD